MSNPLGAVGKILLWMEDKDYMFPVIHGSQILHSHKIMYIYVTQKWKRNCVGTERTHGKGRERMGVCSMYSARCAKMSLHNTALTSQSLSLKQAIGPATPWFKSWLSPLAPRQSCACPCCLEAHGCYDSYLMVTDVGMKTLHPRLTYQDYEW